MHDSSDDTILIFKGQADLRQGDLRHRFRAGQGAYVPAGQIHGTITIEHGTEMISFQTPPDIALYSGSRDSSKPGAALPEGIITPGAVKYFEFGGKNGLFVHPGVGARRIAVGYRRIAPGDSFSQSVGAGQEAVVFVRRGEVQTLISGKPERAGERDAAFVQGPAKLQLRNVSKAEAIIIHALAPPEHSN